MKITAKRIEDIDIDMNPKDYTDIQKLYHMVGALAEEIDTLREEIKMINKGNSDE